MRLPLRYYGDPILRAKAKPVENITPEIIQLAEDMIETMIACNGVGLAAPQIGQSIRLYVCRDEIKNFEGEYFLGEPKVMINPTLSNPSSETASEVEGCLSIPKVHLSVERPKKIHIRYQNLQGEFREEGFTDFFARVNMHENDHLNGVLHIDRASLEDRKKVETALREIKKKYSASK
jgi:peptide deformylase